MNDSWLVEVIVGNEDCPFKEFLLKRKYHACEKLDYRPCAYETCPHKLPRTQEEYNKSEVKE